MRYSNVTRAVLSIALLWAAVGGILHYSKTIAGMAAYGTGLQPARLLLPFLLFTEITIAVVLWIERYATLGLGAAVAMFTAIAICRLQSAFIPLCGTWYPLFWGPRTSASIGLLVACIALSVVTWHDLTQSRASRARPRT